MIERYNMKIFGTGNGHISPNPTKSNVGGWVKYDDIKHLLPPEIPEITTNIFKVCDNNNCGCSGHCRLGYINPNKF